MMAVLFAASSVSDTSAVPPAFSDKILHIGSYAALGVTVFRGFAGARFAAMTRGRALATVLFCILYGVSDEFHQSFVPGRTPDVRDLVADGAGAALGVAALMFLKAVWGRRSARVFRDAD